MIPYFHIPHLDLKIVTIEPFGVLVATGILLGVYSARKRAARLGLDPEEAHSLAFWVVVGSFIMAHVVSIVFYFPERLVEAPWKIFFIWEGISSMGGFLGAFVTSWWYCRKRKLPYLAYADVLVWAVVLGWIFGRMGCTIAHDHPGMRTDFFLAVRYPGGARHDLGFYEFLFTVLVLYPLTRLLGRKPRPDGFFLAVVPIVYSPVRFFFDFLRSTDFGNVDPRYWGLTAAQWLCFPMMGAGIWLLLRVLKNEPRPLTEPEKQQGRGKKK